MCSQATADNEHALLFRALPWSYGTLGVLVAAELRLVRLTSQYVRLQVRVAGPGALTTCLVITPRTPPPPLDDV